MVFTLPPSEISPWGTGLLLMRNTGKYTTLLVFESFVGLLVALSNIIVIAILISGWKRLMKNHFYIVVVNLIVFTSLKGGVELGFVVPYYMMQSSGERNVIGYFPKRYEYLMFNVSVLADYGKRVLFFSMVIAINRYLSIASPAVQNARPSMSKIGISCLIAWVASALIPLLFYFCGCEYHYSDPLKLYINQCSIDTPWINKLLNCLIYLTYACAIIVLALYLLIFVILRREHHARSKHSTSVQMKLLTQSVVIFILYACSMLSVFILTFINPGEFVFDLAYAENLLNLSIAAIYPICFLAMSGEMRSILISALVPNFSGRVNSIASINLIVSR